MSGKFRVMFRSMFPNGWRPILILVRSGSHLPRDNPRWVWPSLTWQDFVGFPPKVRAVRKMQLAFLLVNAMCLLRIHHYVKRFPQVHSSRKDINNDSLRKYSHTPRVTSSKSVQNVKARSPKTKSNIIQVPSKEVNGKTRSSQHEAITRGTV